MACPIGSRRMELSVDKDTVQSLHYLFNRLRQWQRSPTLQYSEEKRGKGRVGGTRNCLARNVAVAHNSLTIHHNWFISALDHGQQSVNVDTVMTRVLYGPGRHHLVSSYILDAVPREFIDGAFGERDYSRAAVSSRREPAHSLAMQDLVGAGCAGGRTLEQQNQRDKNNAASNQSTESYPPPASRHQKLLLQRERPEQSTHTLTRARIGSRQPHRKLFDDRRIFGWL